MSRPVTILYFYRTRWGAHDEFVELFERNHWPILREQIASGRLLEVRRSVPRFHGDGRADWDILVTITYRDWAAVEAHSEAEIAARLFPDRDRYRAEERRRFELLDAHWDVPLEDRPLGADRRAGTRWLSRSSMARAVAAAPVARFEATRVGPLRFGTGLSWTSTGRRAWARRRSSRRSVRASRCP